ncbi:hypothetical protein C8F04DRAFT_1237006 [Mycena alexandri]|uniref:Uncharacterized protein n=1 Tax=Mycena alexandri TaxID=1745969 RepID=A0AAD6SL00_9AGAR|nr:hypothetical protein C8F04DRAFT_1237006 [Mycena alexandri]
MKQWGASATPDAIRQKISCGFSGPITRFARDLTHAADGDRAMPLNALSYHGWSAWTKEYMDQRVHTMDLGCCAVRKNTPASALDLEVVRCLYTPTLSYRRFSIGTKYLPGRVLSEKMESKCSVSFSPSGRTGTLHSAQHPYELREALRQPRMHCTGSTRGARGGARKRHAAREWAGERVPQRRGHEGGGFRRQGRRGVEGGVRTICEAGVDLRVGHATPAMHRERKGMRKGSKRDGRLSPAARGCAAETHVRLRGLCWSGRVRCSSLPRTTHNTQEDVLGTQHSS